MCLAFREHSILLGCKYESNIKAKIEDEEFVTWARVKSWLSFCSGHIHSGYRRNKFLGTSINHRLSRVTDQLPLGINCLADRSQHSQACSVPAKYLHCSCGIFSLKYGIPLRGKTLSLLWMCWISASMATAQECASEGPCVGGNIMAMLDVTSSKVSLRFMILGPWMSWFFFSF